MAAATKDPPSTAPPNPLEESFAKVMGTNPLSSDTGTAGLINYDSDAGFRAPGGDVITISGDPGTGATTAETWSHDIQLENLRREQLEFEYQQQQADIANALKQEESKRAAASLALSQGQYGIQQQEAARAAALAPYQLQSAQYGAEGARLANQAAAYDVAAKRRAEQDALSVQAAMRENAAMNQWLGGRAMDPQAQAAYQAYSRPQDQNVLFSQRQGGGGQYARTPPGTNPYTGTYQPQRGYMTPAQLERARYGGMIPGM